MKTIIKKPSYQMRCPCCGCHFTFENNDTNADGNLDRKQKWITCPHCDNNIKIRDDNMTLLPIVKVRLKNEPEI